MLFVQYIPSTFFDALNRHYPQSITDRPLRNFLMYSQFGNWWTPGHDDDDGQPLPRKVCAWLDDATYDQHYRSSTFIDRIRAHLPGLAIQEYVWGETPNLITNDGTTDAFKADAAEAARLLPTLSKTDLVHYFTGNKFRPQSMKPIYNETKERAAMISAPMNALQTKFCQYLNDLPTNTFTKTVERNFAEAWKIAETFPFDKETTRAQAFTALLGIRQTPKPIYRSTEKSARLFTVGSSLAMIKSQLRRALTRGWTEFDVKNCYVSIVAKDWDIPSLTAVLKEHGSIWEYLARYDLTQHKKALKSALVCLIGGAQVRDVRNALTKSIGGAPTDTFLELSVIQDLVAAREREIARIKAEHRCNFTNAKSIISKQLSATEMRLMEPLVDYSIAHREDCFMTLYQFDGASFTFAYNDETKRARHIEAITQAVEANGRALGYCTRLESVAL